MPRSRKEQLGCFIALPPSSEFEEVREAINVALKSATFRAISFHDEPGTGWSIREKLMGEMAQADCAIADLTNRNPNVYFEIGIAQAMGKVVFPIVQQDEFDQIPFDLHDIQTLLYKPTPRGMRVLTEKLSAVLREFRRWARNAAFTPGVRIPTPFFIDWDKLDPSDAENLCRELLSQLGLRRIEWYKESREIDLVAEYPRKDPDGFEYRELWMVSMGRNEPMELVLDMAGSEPEFFLRHLLRGDERFERLWSSEESASVTLLFIALRGRPNAEHFEMIREQFSRKARKRGSLLSLRVRLWDREYLTTLVQQFPTIGYKYFSDEARSLAKYRKGPEELYRENVVLSERLAISNAALEEEKNRRIRAERDAIWKDISFAAAHKIGNPIFAIETDLDPLEKRIHEIRTNDAIEVVANIRSAVDKAKNIVEQFKSLTKAQHVNPVPTLLKPILMDCCKILEAKNVKCEVECPSDIRIFGDTERLSELFDELATNALHWLDKPKKKISVTAALADATSLPSAIDSNRKYVLVHFRDNGPGVSFENKTRIFEAFFSTYDQGTGLGLALSRRIVEGHGGAIIESGVPGKGADFEIYLPLAEDPKK